MPVLVLVSLPKAWELATVEREKHKEQDSVTCSVVMSSPTPDRNKHSAGQGLGERPSD